MVPTQNLIPNGKIFCAEYLVDQHMQINPGHKGFQPLIFTRKGQRKFFTNNHELLPYLEKLKMLEKEYKMFKLFMTDAKEMQTLASEGTKYHEPAPAQSSPSEPAQQAADASQSENTASTLAQMQAQAQSTQTPAKPEKEKGKKARSA